MILGDLLRVVGDLHNVYIYNGDKSIDTSMFSEIMKNYDNIVDNVSANSYGQLVIQTHEE